ncbi:hypothetical protein [Nocardioides dongxiaopingii]|uniref:hypothetical protein n=1 Tax=Nocardioides dongxiaopingii TaxID=2576036 RepID=UPI0010C76D39|nr:hypothetical protein [Nocardioides dongxiaopingii]
MNQQTDLPDDDAMARLVAADPTTPTPPDLAALRAGGRRLVRRRRLAVGAAAAAVVLAVAVPLAVVGGPDGVAPDSGPAAPSSTRPDPSTAPTTGSTTATTPPDAGATDNVDPPPPGTVEPVRVPIPGGGRFSGEWEEGEILGEMVELGDYYGYEQVLYAAATGPGAADACLSLGVRYQGRILRLFCATAPAADTSERFVMWGGMREEPGVVDTVEGPGYVLVGSVPGDAEVSISAQGQATRPVTTARTDVVPGYTVFVDQAPWVESWDELQLAPLTVTTDGDLSFDVRRRSYVS